MGSRPASPLRRPSGADAVHQLRCARARRRRGERHADDAGASAGRPGADHGAQAHVEAAARRLAGRVHRRGDQTVGPAHDALGRRCPAGHRRRAAVRASSTRSRRLRGDRPVEPPHLGPSPRTRAGGEDHRRHGRGVAGGDVARSRGSRHQGGQPHAARARRPFGGPALAGAGRAAVGRSLPDRPGHLVDRRDDGGETTQLHRSRPGAGAAPGRRGLGAARARRACEPDGARRAGRLAGCPGRGRPSRR